MKKSVHFTVVPYEVDLRASFLSSSMPITFFLICLAGVPNVSNLLVMALKKLPSPQLGSKTESDALRIAHSAINSEILSGV